MCSEPCCINSTNLSSQENYESYGHACQSILGILRMNERRRVFSKIFFTPCSDSQALCWPPIPRKGKFFLFTCSPLSVSSQIDLILYSPAQTHFIAFHRKIHFTPTSSLVDLDAFRGEEKFQEFLSGARKFLKTLSYIRLPFQEH